jgi:hypothetical protein
MPGAFGQQVADDHEIVGEHRGADKQREALGAFGPAALHAAATHQHRDAPLDAGPESLALLALCAATWAMPAKINAHNKPTASTHGTGLELERGCASAADTPGGIGLICHSIPSPSNQVIRAPKPRASWSKSCVD